MKELAYTEKQANTSVTATTEAGATTIVSAPFILLDGSTDIVIEFGTNAWGQTSTSAVNRLVLFDDSGTGATAIGTLFQGVAFSTSTGKPGFTVRRKLTPAAGYHSYSIRGWVSAASTWTVAGDTFGSGIDSPAYIRVFQDEPMTRPTVVGESSFDLTSSDSWTHTSFGLVGTGHGLIRAAVVLIAQAASSADSISGVTYGGTAMTRVATNGFAQDTAGETGAVYVYFLDSDTIPQGDQTVAVTVSAGTAAKQARCFTLQSDGPTRVVTSGKVEGDTANPSVTLATPASFSGVLFNVLFSGHNAPGSVTPGLSPMFAGRDFGTTVGLFEAGFGSGANIASGWTAASEDVAMSTLAIETGALLNCAAGSFAVTGTDATLTAASTDKPINAEPAAFTVTGTAATLLADRAVSSDPGSYAVTGTDATLLADRVLSVDLGSFAVTGVDATLAAGLVFNAEPGSFAVTGADATVVPGFAALADPGAFAVTGVAAELEYVPVGDSPLDAQPGSFAVTGADAGLAYGALSSIDAQPGTVAVTGTSATLAAGYVFNAEPGAYTVSGTDATVAAGFVVSADPGSYAVTGSDATTVVGYSINAEPGTYAVTGAVADLVYTQAGAFTLNAESGVYTVTGINATTLADRALDAQPGTFTVTGADAALGQVFDFAIDAQPGVFAVTGSAATLTWVPGLTRETTRGGRIRWNTAGRIEQTYEGAVS